MMKKTISLILTLLTFCFCQTNSLAQKDQTLFFGVNIGAKLANKHYAVRYSGLYQNELYYALNTQYNYNQLYILLGDKDFYLPYDAYPGNIKYTPGLLTGVTLGYQVSPNFQMSLDGNFSKLKVRSAFTIVVEDPSNMTTEPVIELGELYAEESRFDGRFNLDYVFDGDKVKFISGISGIFSAWRLDEQFAMLRNYKMPFYSVHNPSNNITNKVSDVGFGGGITLGLEYRVNEKIVSQLIYQPYYAKMDYGFTPSKNFLIQHDFTVRFLWK